MDNPNNAKALFYSCILYEQEKEKNSTGDACINKHILFWEKELVTGEAYLTLLDDAKKTKFQGWPSSITIECSTYCNARCTNCTHGELMKTGVRLQKNVDLREIQYRIRKAKLWTVLFGVTFADIGPAGLGEPLIHPDIILILRYMVKFFPKVGLNTNVSLLKGELAKEMAKTKLDYIYLSLSYFNRETYEKEIGLDYDNTINNILEFIKIAKAENFSGMILIHIFNNNLNSEEDIKNFKNMFEPLLREKDNLEIRKYIELTDNGAKTRSIKRKMPKPCYQLWQVMVVDVEGNIYPCCSGLWKKHDEYLTIGNISDSAVTVIENLKSLRKKQLEGNYGTCLKCDTFWQNIKFKLPLYCYNKDASIFGNIQYKETMLNSTQLEEIERLILVD